MSSASTSEKANKYEAKYQILPPEVMLVTREADYVATPRLRFEPLTGGIAVDRVDLHRIPKVEKEK